MIRTHARRPKGRCKLLKVRLSDRVKGPGQRAGMVWEGGKPKGYRGVGLREVFALYLHQLKLEGKQLDLADHLKYEVAIQDLEDGHLARLVGTLSGDLPPARLGISDLLDLRDWGLVDLVVRVAGPGQPAGIERIG